MKQINIFRISLIRKKNKTKFTKLVKSFRRQVTRYDRKNIISSTSIGSKNKLIQIFRNKIENNFFMLIHIINNNK